MKTINFLNEKHQPKQSVRSEVRAQVIEYLTSNTNFIQGPNGLYLQVAIDSSTNEPIYANVNLTISMADPTKAKEKKVKEKEEKQEIGNLFE